MRPSASAFGFSPWAFSPLVGHSVAVRVFDGCQFVASSRQFRIAAHLGRVVDEAFAHETRTSAVGRRAVLALLEARVHPRHHAFWHIRQGPAPGGRHLRRSGLSPVPFPAGQTAGLCLVCLRCKARPLQGRFPLVPEHLPTSCRPSRRHFLPSHCRR